MLWLKLVTRLTCQRTGFSMTNVQRVLQYFPEASSLLFNLSGPRMHVARGMCNDCPKFHQGKTHSSVKWSQSSIISSNQHTWLFTKSSCHSLPRQIVYMKHPECLRAQYNMRLAWSLNDASNDGRLDNEPTSFSRFFRIVFDAFTNDRTLYYNGLFYHGRH